MNPVTMKKKKRLNRKFIDLKIFEELFQEFLSIPTWTHAKYEARDAFYSYLESQLVTSIRVKPKSKYNYCSYTHTFTIIKVSSQARGKLFPLRGELVLIRCSSVTGAWTQYSNDIYLLKDELSPEDLSRLKENFSSFYIDGTAN